MGAMKSDAGRDEEPRDDGQEPVADRGADAEQPPPTARDRGSEPADRPRPQRRFLFTALVGLLLLAAIYILLVLTEAGQRAENLALRGAELRSVTDREAGLERLSQVTVVVFAAAMAAIYLVGLLRRRPGFAIAVVLTMGVAVVLSEVLKDVLPRPALVDGPAWILRPSFPSGSAAVAAAMAVGALLVAPDRLRWLVVPAGAIYAAVIAEAIQTTGWHRLSDTLGGVLLVLVVAAAGLAVVARAGLVQPSTHGRIDRRVRTGVLVAGTVAIGLGTIILLLAATFPLLASPDSGRRAFLQTAFPLVGSGLTLLAMLVAGRMIEPYTLGRRAAPPPTAGPGGGSDERSDDGSMAAPGAGDGPADDDTEAARDA